MTGTAVTYPARQHWRAGGFRVSVLLYKSHTGPCATCGKRPARHAVWADGVTPATEGFSGAAADFCDEHRPARGTLPDLEYQRIVRGHTSASAVTFEALTARPDWACTGCGKAAILRRELRCDGCDDPAHWRQSTARVVAWAGAERTETSRRHDPHVIGESFSCPACRDQPHGSAS